MFKIAKIVVLGVVMSTLVGCDLLPYLSYLTTTQSSTETSTIPPSTTSEIIYEDLEPGERDKLVAVMEKINTSFYEKPQVVIQSDTEITVFNSSYGRVTRSNLEMNLDLEDLYLYSVVTNGSNNMPDIKYVCEKEDKIVEYTNNEEGDFVESIKYNELSEQNMINLLSEFGFSSDGNVDYLGNVEKISEIKYHAQVGYSKWSDFLGAEFVQLFADIEGVDYNQHPIDLVYLFDRYNKGYSLELSLEVTGNINGNYIKIEMIVNQDFRIVDFEKKSLSEMGFNIPTSPTIEAIEYDGRLSYSMEFIVYPNQDNWTRIYLEPGYYEVDNIENLEILNENRESVFTENPFRATEAGYYYFNLQSSSLTRLRFGVKDLHIQDISILTVEGIESGSIKGYSEGEYDIIKVIFPKQEANLVVILDVSNSQFSTTEMDIFPYTYCSNIKDYCPYLISPTWDIEITFRTDFPGDYQIDYRFIEFTSTSQTPTNLEDISVYNETNPIILGRGVEFAYFLITIDHYGEYAIFTEEIYGRAIGITYDIYSLDGNKLELSGVNSTYLKAGTYIVKQYYKFNESVDVYYPVLYEYDH